MGRRKVWVHCWLRRKWSSEGIDGVVVAGVFFNLNWFFGLYMQHALMIGREG